jgi:hypothetical protein
MISLCQNAVDVAVDHLQQALQLDREVGSQYDQGATLLLLGRCALALGQRLEAVELLQEALIFMPPDHDLFSQQLRIISRFGFTTTLSSLEAAHENGDEYRAFCLRFREEQSNPAGSTLVQWFLAPGHPNTEFTRLDVALDKDNLRSQIHDLKWYDPFNDCTLKVEDKVEIHAVNGRDLWVLNRSAPRLLKPVAGNFAMGTTCSPASDQKPAIGGLLIWKDEQNYLCLDTGVLGEREILFKGCLENRDRVIGRGSLPFGSVPHRDRPGDGQDEPTGQIVLRLERVEPYVNALCSADGQTWYTVGRVEFSVPDPVEVGLHAIGNIDRTIYPGAFPEGTAIQFESFYLWKRP